MLPVIVLLAALLPAPARGIPIDQGWSAAPIWDDGLAEVAVYDAGRTIYDVPRRFETVMLTVKEEMDLARGVKADPPYEGRDLVTVLKMNLVSRIPTDNYPYDYMTSVFVEKRDPRVLLKMAQSSQEWCGTTYKEIVAFGGSDPRMIFHSYFDGQADGSRRLPVGPAALPEEQLFLLMRAARIPSTDAVPIGVYESIVTNSASEPRLLSLVARGAGRETIDTPAGRFEAARIDLGPATAGQGAPMMSFWIEEAPRRALLRFESEDGRRLLLKSIGRRAYWKR